MERAVLRQGTTSTGERRPMRDFSLNLTTQELGLKRQWQFSDHI